MSVPNFVNWGNLDTHSNECVHVLKFRNFKGVSYIVCYHCKTRISSEKIKITEKAPDIEEYRNKDRYIPSKFEKTVIDQFNEKLKKESALHPVKLQLPDKPKPRLKMVPQAKSMFNTSNPEIIKEVYHHGKLISPDEMKCIMNDLPDVPIQTPCKSCNPDPSYEYIINPKNIYKEKLKSGEIKKPKFLLKAPIPIKNI